jgi:hypothetical protein
VKSANATKTGWLLPQEPVQTAAFPLDASRVISDLKSSQIRQDKLAIPRSGKTSLRLKFLTPGSL